MSDPSITLDLYDDQPAVTYTSSILNANGWGWDNQILNLDKTGYGITGLKTLFEPANYGFHVYLINKSEEFTELLGENEALLQKYDEIQVEGRRFKSYMIDKLDPRRKILNRDNDEIYMICVSMTDLTKISSSTVLFLSTELLPALNHITYGPTPRESTKSGGKSYVLRSKKKRYKKSYKKSYKKKTNKKTRKTRRYRK